MEYPSKSPISILHEYFIGLKLASPNYEFISDLINTEHDEVLVKVTALGKCAYGIGLSDQEAKENAALSILYVLTEGEKSDCRNYIGELQQYCHKKSYCKPCYDYYEDSIGDPPIFQVFCSVGRERCNEIYGSIQKAKQNAAKKMLIKLGYPV